MCEATIITWGMRHLILDTMRLIFYSAYYRCQYWIPWDSLDTLGVHGYLGVPWLLGAVLRSDLDHAPAHLGHGCPKRRAWYSVSRCVPAIAYKTDGKQIHTSKWRIVSG